ncbi:MAG: NUDIX domain-containing protein [Parcubacteria group bacterium]|nr:NUDIX domain-containing protein [Parcubacteria group bacterium]
MKKKFLRFSYKIINPIRKIYWFIFRPKTRGVKCFIEYKDSILLVRLSYAHKGWTLPGGGVKCKETFEEGARREAKEETGITLPNIKKIYEYSTLQDYRIINIEVFYSKIEKADYAIDQFEIIDAKWFDIRHPIPFPHGRSLPELIQKFLELKNNGL